MNSLKRFLRIIQIRNCAQYIALRKGHPKANGWIYEDDNLCICADQFITSIYRKNSKKQYRIVYFYRKERDGKYYRNGDWEHHFALCFNSAKTRS